MNFKRLAALLTAVIIFLTLLSACGRDEPEPADGSSGSTEAETTKAETTKSEATKAETTKAEVTGAEVTKAEITDILDVTEHLETSSADPTLKVTMTLETTAAPVPDAVPEITNVPMARQRPKDTWNGYSLVPIYDNGMEYVWSRLSDNVKDNVVVMMNAMSNEQDRCDLVHPVSESEIWEFVHFVHDHLCGYTHVNFYNYGYWDDGNGNVIALQFVYLDNYGEAKAKNKELQKKVDEIVASAPETSERDRIKYFHDYVVKNCTYSYDGRSGTSYGALIDEKAVCQGYAHAMQMLLSRAGFDAVPAIGSVEGGGYHKWNYVKLSDGKWYVIDATWDDPVGTPKGVVATYNYFMITDEQVEKDHSRRYGSRYFAMPEAK